MDKYLVFMVLFVLFAISLTLVYEEVVRGPEIPIVLVRDTMDVGWNQEYWEIEFGNLTRCDGANSDGDRHAMEIINRGDVPVNVRLRYDADLFSDPDSTWMYKGTCKAINMYNGKSSDFPGPCWDGLIELQSTYTNVTNVDTNLVTCLNYRSLGALNKPGIRIDHSVNIACTEENVLKNATIVLTFEQADLWFDCGGDDGYDPGG